jgi:chromosome partitioning protein
MQHVVFNQKGGVGKSTITCNLAAISAWQGMRTLVIDLDSQGNSTRYLLGSDMPDEMPNVAEFFEQSLKFTIRDKSASEYIVHTQWEGLDVIPSSPLLDELHGKLESRHKIYKLRDALELLAEDYDQIYIDTPPALNFYTRCALIAAQGCLIPFDCDDFSRRALYTLLENVQEIQSDHNADLKVEGIIVNQFQSRANLPQRMVQELIDEGLPVLQPYLRSSVRIRESHEQSLPMIFLDPSHMLTQEFVALQRLAQHPFWLKQCHQCIHQRLRLGGMVGSEIAHIHIHRHPGLLGPGVHAQVRFGQEHRGGHAAGAVWRGGERMGQLIDGLQAGTIDFTDAALDEPHGVGQPRRFALAAGQISGEVQALHSQHCRLFWG